MNRPEYYSTFRQRPPKRILKFEFRDSDNEVNQKIIVPRGNLHKVKAWSHETETNIEDAWFRVWLNDLLVCPSDWDTPVFDGRAYINNPPVGQVLELEVNQPNYEDDGRIRVEVNATFPTNGLVVLIEFEELFLSSESKGSGQTKVLTGKPHVPSKYQEYEIT